MGGSLDVCARTHVEARGCHCLSWSLSIIYIAAESLP